MPYYPWLRATVDFIHQVVDPVPEHLPARDPADRRGRHGHRHQPDPGDHRPQHRLARGRGADRRLRRDQRSRLGYSSACPACWSACGLRRRRRARPGHEGARDLARRRAVTASRSCRSCTSRTSATRGSPSGIGGDISAVFIGATIVLLRRAARLPRRSRRQRLARLAAGRAADRRRAREPRRPGPRRRGHRLHRPAAVADLQPGRPRDHGRSAPAALRRRALGGATERLVRPDAERLIVHLDEDLAVIEKPAGLVVHSAPSHRGETLVDLLEGIAGGGEGGRPGHRPSPRQGHLGADDRRAERASRTGRSRAW